jgi:hypothetical protein
MRRSLLAPVLALSLAACAPALTTSAPDPDQGRLSLTGPPLVLDFVAGLSDVKDLVVTISGADLRVNAPKYCRADRQQIVCTVPTLPKGGNFMLPMKGSNISAVATYKRLSGQSFSSEARQ